MQIGAKLRPSSLQFWFADTALTSAVTCGAGIAAIRLPGSRHAVLALLLLWLLFHYQQTFCGNILPIVTVASN